MQSFKYFMIFILLIFYGTKSHEEYKYTNWKFHFPAGSGIGLFLAIAVPLDLPNKNAYLSYNFEANYGLPENQSYFEYPPLIQKRIDRKLVYKAVETKMQSNGYNGKACLLRIICEIAFNSIEHANGVLGDILHIIFTPSTSTNEGLSLDYEKAEKYGKIKNDCNKYARKCSTSFLDLLSWVGKST